MKLLSLFSGIGGFERGLENVGIPIDLVNYCEIDKSASKAYSIIHNVPESLNLGDIKTIDTSILPNDIDLITYGFPCQDISLAGNMKGFEHEGEVTRSGLFFEALRIIEATKPKFAIAENVKNLVSKRFTKEFQIVLESLESAGYINYWKTLNSKDFGIPQNRERVFIISIRKDIDKGFEFPQGFPLELRLKDFLDDEVDEKYYVSSKGVNYILSPKRGMCTDINADVCQTLTANGQSNWTGSFISPDIKEIKKSTTIGSKDPVRVELYDGRIIENGVIVKENNKRGFTIAEEGDSINLERPNSKTRRGRVGRGVAQTLNTSCLQAVVTGEVEEE